jgi:RAB protein geranylgeranyltransferase component A
MRAHTHAQVPFTKSDVFSSDLLGMVEKRLLMKFSHAAFGAANDDPHAHDPANKTDAHSCVSQSLQSRNTYTSKPMLF